MDTCAGMDIDKGTARTAVHLLTSLPARGPILEWMEAESSNICSRKDFCAKIEFLFFFFQKRIYHVEYLFCFIKI